MTTIAYDGETLSADTLVLDEGGHVLTETEKIKVVNGPLLYIAGGSGLLQTIREFQEWAADPSSIDFPVNKGAGTTLFGVTEEGLLIAYETSKHEMYRTTEAVAFGSGASFATAAMHLGESTASAVRLAARFDCATGGSVTTLECVKPKKETEDDSTN